MPKHPFLFLPRSFAVLGVGAQPPVLIEGLRAGLMLIFS
jgi:hypothetical protein